jgi:hypothetical protein
MPDTDGFPRLAPPFIREGPVRGPCRDCGPAGKLRIVHRLVARPIGTFSLAGAQMKVSAYWWPWMVCDNCGGESKGKFVPAVPPPTD